MARIKIEDIRAEAEKNNWCLISDKYENLDSELIFQCPEGHTVYNSWKKLRNKFECPICKKNQYKDSAKIISKQKNVRRILALDQATHITGWAIFDNDKLVTFGKFKSTLEHEEERTNQIKNWLVNMISNWQPDEVGIEDIHFQGTTSSGDPIGIKTYKVLAHLQGVLIDTLFEQKITFKICPPATWREHCQVKGKTSSDKKRSMQKKVKDWFDINVTNDEADAIGIGKYMADTLTKWESVCWE